MSKVQMDWLVCKHCGANYGYKVIKHEGGGCGYVNQEKSDRIHLHFFCRCGWDYVLKGVMA